MFPMLLLKTTVDVFLNRIILMIAEFLYKDFLTDNLPFSFTQSEVGYFRWKLVVDIVRGKLLYDMSYEEVGIDWGYWDPL